MSHSTEAESAEEPTPPGTRAFFVFFALVGALGVASRFDVVLGRLPPLLAEGLLLVHGPLLFVAGLLERRLRPEEDDGPTWMAIRDRAVRAGFTLSFTTLTIATLQAFDIALGPIDPTPPESFPLAQRALWYAGFSFGMGFANYLAAVGTLVPALRAVARPVLHAPLAAGAGVMALLGAGVAFGLRWAAEQAAVQEGLGSLAGWLERPEVLVGLIVVPLVLPALFARARSA
ncbi:MAG TPA: hypothetical protein RMH85_23175 [Polyangiaceae bacterium LLY-WYZ-15_(1-7)]|nr:hypothetical protein [Sandaracinus sp.]HJK99871.1 hypothetical protein [Polyangiaceae bacterium LLY-WYZ-15_(1-7)]MBJ75082.1 hypothetical protein [Sandaracinus sp.]HJL11397.1 hypothetical protein [Polyangiaceae bacterium LLY-WYZ-15_(1-7)]HJL28645.1 hypothetical protein [Polyangiaceae bacterium LLY-WYZ-15_(1-7)]